ncbi:hypothetical protein ACFC1B_28210 [Streptomyces xiamenensis]|uniref:hypothetical protein n=1 Tax=Streptomyces xiamenensis TaxID=408015 RepID=UPI0035E16893
MAAVPLDLLDRIRMLEAQVRELSGRANMRPALNTILGGPVSVGDGGYFEAIAPGGARIFSTGRFGNGRYGVAIRRDGGALALDAGSDTSAAGMIRLFSRGGYPIVTDDVYADDYLGRPSIPIPWQPTTGNSTSSSGLVVAWTTGQRVQCAVFYLGVETWAPSGTSGRVEVQCRPDGDPEWQTWESWTVTGGSAGQWTSRQITRPMHGIPYFLHANWRIRQQVTAGAGPIATNVLGSYQRNTFSAAEAPTPPPAAMATVLAESAEVERDQALAAEPPTPAPAPRPGLHRITD